MRGPSDAGVFRGAYGGRPLKGRPVKPLREELYEADREAFDKAVLQAFGLEDLHDRIRNALSTMVKVRTEELP